MKKNKPPRELLEKGLRFLRYRPRSEKELRDYFKKKRTSEKETDQVIQKLKKLKLVNDQQFTEWWIDQRNSFRPRGKMALRSELRQKGVDEKLAQKLIEEMIDETKLAKKAIKKKKGSYEQLAGFLARRGFSWQTIKEVL